MNISTQTISSAFSRFLHRYHIIVFVIIVLGALGVGIYFTYQTILSVDEAHGYTAPASDASFDTETKDNITSLRRADFRLNNGEGRPLRLEGVRINPFIE